MKQMTTEEIEEYGNTLPIGHTRNEAGDMLTHKNSNGFWGEFAQ